MAAASQHADDETFRLRSISASDRDLGSREVLKDEPDLVWYPAEVNTSIRPGWFWHSRENEAVKPLDKLIDIYEKSVGGNATFLLNVPPTSEGLFHANDVARLKQLGEYLRDTYGENLVAKASRLSASHAAPGCGIDNAREDDEAYYLPAAQGAPVEIVLEWDEPQPVRRLVMKEQLRLSQRVERYAIDLMDSSGRWHLATGGSVIGHKRIIRLGSQPIRGLRIRIIDARVAPTLKFIGVYR